MYKELVSINILNFRLEFLLVSKVQIQALCSSIKVQISIFFFFKSSSFLDKHKLLKASYKVDIPHAYL